MPAVVVSNLRITYGDTVAVDDVSFEAPEGQVTVLLGPNGAGKTSTVECLEGFQRPSAGSVLVGGLDPFADRKTLVRTTGAMLQDGGVYPSVRPREALETTAAYYPESHSPEEMLDLVGLTDRAKTPWRSLSGGEQQRLSLALALIGKPEIVFLDEPSAGVDVSGRHLIRDLISGLRDRGVSVILTSHDLTEVEELADRIIILDGGRVVADGTTDELLEGNESDSFSFRAVPGLDVAVLGERLGTAVLETRPGQYVVQSTPSPALIATLTQWLSEHDVLLGNVSAGRKGLEEVFLKLTTERSSAVPAPSRRSRRKSRGDT